MIWHVEVLKDAEDELLALPPDLRARFVRIAELLAEFGPQSVGMPHVRPLVGKLWEIRMKGRDGIGRAIYFTRTGRRLIVLHVFIKKTQQTPRHAIEVAQARMKEMEQ